MRALTSGASHFFGFHDLTPWNTRTDELLCLRTQATEDHVPMHDETADVVTVEETDGNDVKVGETRAWNWQQASRQRWLPAFGRRVIFYNAQNESGFESRIVDLD